MSFEWNDSEVIPPFIFPKKNFDDFPFEICLREYYKKKALEVQSNPQEQQVPEKVTKENPEKQADNPKPKDRFISFPRISWLTKHENVIYLSTVKDGCAKAGSVLEDIQRRVLLEQKEFQEYLFRAAEKFSSDYQFLPPDADRYYKEYREEEYKKIIEYPRYYILHDQIALVPPKSKYVAPPFMHVKTLLEMGVLPKLIAHPTTESKKFFNLTNYERVIKRCPLKGTDVGGWNRPVCSKDPNLQKLAQKFTPKVIISSSALKCLLDHQGNGLDRQWEIPVVIREEEIKGKKVKHKVVFIDKPLPSTSLTRRAKNAWYNKLALRSTLLHPEHVSTVNLGTKQSGGVKSSVPSAQDEWLFLAMDDKQGGEGGKSRANTSLTDYEFASQDDCDVTALETFGASRSKKSRRSTLNVQESSKKISARKDHDACPGSSKDLPQSDTSTRTLMRVESSGFVNKHIELSELSENDSGDEKLAGNHSYEDKPSRKPINFSIGDSSELEPSSGTQVSDRVDKAEQKIEPSSEKMQEINQSDESLGQKPGGITMKPVKLDLSIDSEDDPLVIDEVFKSPVSKEHSMQRSSKKDQSGHQLRNISDSGQASLPENKDSLNLNPETNKSPKPRKVNRKRKSSSSIEEHLAKSKQSSGPTLKAEDVEEPLSPDPQITDQVDLMSSGMKIIPLSPIKAVKTRKVQGSPQTSNKSPPKQKGVPLNTLDTILKAQDDLYEIGNQKVPPEDMPAPDLLVNSSKGQSQDPLAWEPIEDPGNYQQPSLHNVTYNLWQLGDIPLIIRSSLDGTQTAKYGSVTKCLSCKLEYQPHWGAEKVTCSEACHEWISSFLANNANVLRVRVNAFTSEFMLYEDQKIQDIINPVYGFNPSSAVMVLYGILRNLISLDKGNYLVSHAPGATTASIKRGVQRSSGVYDLHVAQLKQETVSATLPWIPLDPTIILERHKRNQRIPATFTPKNTGLRKQRKGNKKKKSMNKKKQKSK